MADASTSEVGLTQTELPDSDTPVAPDGRVATDLNAQQGNQEENAAEPDPPRLQLDCDTTLQFEGDQLSPGTQDEHQMRFTYSAPCSPVHSPKLPFAKTKDIQAYAKRVLDEGDQMAKRHYGIEYRIWEARQRRVSSSPAIQVRKSTPISLVTTVQDVYQMGDEDKRTWKSAFSELNPRDVSLSAKQVEAAREQTLRVAQAKLADELAYKKAEAAMKAAKEAERAANLAARQAANAQREASIQAAVRQSQEMRRNQLESQQDQRHMRANTLLQQNQAKKQQELQQKHEMETMRARSAHDKKSQLELDKCIRHLEDHQLHQTRRDLRKGRLAILEQNAARIQAQKDHDAIVHARFATQDARMKEYLKACAILKAAGIDARNQQIRQAVAQRQAELAKITNQRFERAQAICGEVESQRLQWAMEKVMEMQMGAHRVMAKRQQMKMHERELQERCRAQLIAQYWAKELEQKAAATKKLPAVRPDVSTAIKPLTASMA